MRGHLAATIVLAVLSTAALDARAQKEKKGDHPEAIAIAAEMAEIASRAGTMPKPLWELPLNNLLIRTMRRAGEQRILLDLAHYDDGFAPAGFRMIDATRGTEMWRIPAGAQEGEIDLVAIDADTVVISRLTPESFAWSGLDTRSGKQNWTRQWGELPRSHSIMPDGSAVLVVLEKDDVQHLEYVDISSGETWWTVAANAGSSCKSAQMHIEARDNEIYYASCSLCRYDLESGKEQWCRTPAAQPSEASRPVIHGPNIIAANANDELELVEAATGRTIWSQRLDIPQPTSITASEDFVYVRGMGAAETRDPYYIESRATASGDLRWRFNTRRPLNSNIVEAGNRVLIASHRYLYGLDRDSGQRVFRKKLVANGKSFPVHLRITDEGVVVIGELTIYGINPEDGSQLHFAGFTPMSSQASLDNLDQSIEKLLQTVAELRAMKVAPDRALTSNNSRRAFSRRMRTAIIKLPIANSMNISVPEKTCDCSRPKAPGYRHPWHRNLAG